MKQVIYFCFLLNISFTFACKKSVTQSEQHIPPQIPDITLIQITQPTNAPAQVTDYFSEAYNHLSFAFDGFARVQGNLIQSQYPDYTWKSEMGAWFLILQARVLNEDAIHWNFIVDFNEEGRADWNSWEGDTNADGTTGSFEFYRLDTGATEATSTWSRNNQDQLIVNTHKVLGEYNLEYEIVGNPDNSGSLIVKERDVKIFAANWDASGAGSWASFDITTGQQTGSGNWSS